MGYSASTELLDLRGAIRLGRYDGKRERRPALPLAVAGCARQDRQGKKEAARACPQSPAPPNGRAKRPPVPPPRCPGGGGSPYKATQLLPLCGHHAATNAATTNSLRAGHYPPPQVLLPLILPLSKPPKSCHWPL
ncbi:hypothetical protein CDD82_6423 [Ophiocordyceps australis]|uniref:Uncharacterized protein n=1 Tax=Ophiocordyceps australis TaxID=1399860 RepID=A0A2C5YS68_9HYPO|nr:hypothetical protein CDD82_6423 [Ophiocordyceps australis]